MARTKQAGVHKLKTIAFKVSVDKYETLKKLAELENRTVSNLVDYLVNQSIFKVYEKYEKDGKK